MSENNFSQPDNSVNKAASFRSVPQNTASNGNMPQSTAAYGNVRNDAEAYGNSRRVAERKETHVLSVKEVARMFENSGVARIERTIVNWCQANRQGVARLDAYFEESERKWLITPESAERAIAEEKTKLAKATEPLPHSAANPEAPLKEERHGARDSVRPEPHSDRAPQLEKELMDLKILNSGKDFFIEQLRKERDGFIRDLREGSRRIGQLETELRQLTAPRATSESHVPDSGPKSEITEG